MSCSMWLVVLTKQDCVVWVSRLGLHMFVLATCDLPFSDPWNSKITVRICSTFLALCTVQYMVVWPGLRDLNYIYLASHDIDICSQICLLYMDSSAINHDNMWVAQWHRQRRRLEKGKQETRRQVHVPVPVRPIRKTEATHRTHGTRHTPWAVSHTPPTSEKDAWLAKRHRG